jgi:inhibitor of cysteine peptidase
MMTFDFQSGAPRRSSPPVNPANEFSGTNNQVDNVDEADLLKTDGTYIYTVSNQIFSIILAYPSNKAKVVSKMWFKDFNASALFLEEDYVAVFGTKWNFNSNSVDYTFIKILDVSNRANPFWVREFKVAGKYFDGRKLSNGFIYLVTNYEFSRQ